MTFTQEIQRCPWNEMEIFSLHIHPKVRLPLLVGGSLELCLKLWLLWLANHLKSSQMSLIILYLKCFEDSLQESWIRPLPSQKIFFVKSHILDREVLYSWFWLEWSINLPNSKCLSLSFVSRNIRRHIGHPLAAPKNKGLHLNSRAIMLLYGNQSKDIITI